MTSNKTLAALACLIAPLALAIGGCDKTDDAAATGNAPQGEPVEAVAAPEGRQWSEIVTATDAGGYLMGNPEAPIELVEFASLTCPHCAEFYESAEQELVEKYVNTGRVNFEFRNFVRDPIDITGAMLTRCSAPESFFALTGQVLENQQEFFDAIRSGGEGAYQQAMQADADQRFVMLGELTGMTEFFAARGVSVDQGRDCLSKAETAEALANKTNEASQQYDITGTPTFLINNARIDGLTWPEVEAALQRAGAR